MKIAVLFGSFNPMTTAHVSMLKSAVETLNADRGLFVATNGSPLRPFETERVMLNNMRKEAL